jgi:hypothetical protein
VKPDFAFVRWLNCFCQSRCDCAGGAKISSAVARSSLGFTYRFLEV